MIVLDTHVLLWMDRNDEALGPQTRRWIEQAWRTDVVAVSAISFWESALLARRGRIALLSTRLEGLHQDPADRFIVASAMTAGALLMTADRRILEWPADLARHDARL